MAEREILAQAEANLLPSRFAEMIAARGSYLFTAGNFPGPEWQSIVGFLPDKEVYYQVTIGIAVDHGETPNILAKALICRDMSNDFCHIIWDPTGGA